jgi:hypothetical protein
MEQEGYRFASVQASSVLLSQAAMGTSFRGTSRGGKWGLIIAALVGVPLFFFLMLMDALGDCAPDTNCRHGFFPIVLLPTLLVTIPIFLAVRFAINWSSERDH